MFDYFYRNVQVGSYIMNLKIYRFNITASKLKKNHSSKEYQYKRNRGFKLKIFKKNELKVNNLYMAFDRLNREGYTHVSNISYILPLDKLCTIAHYYKLIILDHKTRTLCV